MYGFFSRLFGGNTGGNAPAEVAQTASPDEEAKTLSPSNSTELSHLGKVAGFVQGTSSFIVQILVLIQTRNPSKCQGGCCRPRRRFRPSPTRRCPSPSTARRFKTKKAPTQRNHYKLIHLYQFFKSSLGARYMILEAEF